MNQQTGFPAQERGGNGSTGAHGALGGTGAAEPAFSGVSDDPSSVGAPRGTGSRYGETGRSEFGAFLDDLSELARGGGHGTDLRGELERRVAQARTRMNAALDQGMEMSARARDQMHRGIEVSRDAVVERPLSSVAIAAIGGLIVGLLLSRRD